MIQQLAGQAIAYLFAGFLFSLGWHLAKCLVDKAK